MILLNTLGKERKMIKTKRFLLKYDNKSEIKVNAKIIKMALGLCHPFIKWIKIKEIKK